MFRNELTELNSSAGAGSTPPPMKILRSSFVGDSNLSRQGPQARPVVEVHFKKTICLIADDGSGTPTLLEDSSVITGFLESKALELNAGERGNTKDVFVVSYHFMQHLSFT